ncbi:Spy/CpxP family protein refolding chaperone [Alishewanella sp. SMS8]|uniref:Spy/CpxP family protein refolding chaperone n=1 Tax=Alishewanella sp. SMS8 TaxID=2994676 RepID=UPI002741BE1F|nr:Spy/CpxP family protein refolding chaperone [Alishewanella sp. SMS8]MDP5205867.1 Spy/CpxP family protein refolding chaperone [Alishewanella sp. SMS9]MDP5458763.1 Spy/CpxP family protein refolding chaperone [Alishewanella sp. SMS8]
MMKAKTLLLTLGTLVAFSSASMAAAPDSAEKAPHQHKQQQQKRQQMAPGAMLKRQLASLDLSAEQKQAVAAVLAEHRANQGDAADRAADKQAWQALMDAPQFDETTAKLLLEKRRAKQEERQLHLLQLRHQINQILTVAQREQLQNQREERRSKIEGRDGEGKPEGRRTKAERSA